MFQEVLDSLAPKNGAHILDCTLGLGGHAEGLLHLAGSATFVGIDADNDNLAKAREHLGHYANCTFIHANFSRLPDLQLGTFDCILADLGVSSLHFDDAERGFSFRFDGPLDMRLDQSGGSTAAEWIARSSEEEIAHALRDFGEVRQYGKLASLIKEAQPKTTGDLRSIVEEFASFRAKSVLPQVFQALRIAVNNELGALRILLDTTPLLLKPGGRLGIISFHSLEDRMVKQHFKKLTTPEINEHTGAPIAEPPFTLLQRKAIKPTEKEIQENPRARSARLRVLIKQ